jgi:PAS domain S-box-containing protein
MLGYQDHELSNQRSSWEALLHPADREEVLGKIGASLASQATSLELEQRLRHKDGTYRWILARAVILRDPQGRPLRMAGSHVDLTGHKQATERLQQANAQLARKSEILRKVVRRLNASQRELRSTQERLVSTAKLELAGTLAAGVAHEVKNPLQTIIMGVHLLSQKLPEVQRTAEMALALEEMSAAVFRAKAIIGDLLTLAQPMEFKPQLQDLHMVIERSIRLLKNALIKAKVTVESHFDPALPPAVIDPQRLEQVFLNLLLNAIQAMPDGGLISIRTRLQRVGEGGSLLLGNFKSGAQVALIDIQDRGTGIAEELLPRVFDPFFTTKPSGVGTGLGLSMAKKMSSFTAEQLS